MIDSYPKLTVPLCWHRPARFNIGGLVITGTLGLHAAYLAAGPMLEAASLQRIPWPQFDRADVPRTPMSRLELRRWLENALPVGPVTADTSRSLEDVMTSPSELVRLAHGWLCTLTDAGRSAQPQASVAALCLFGLGVEGMDRVGDCDICFRRTLPGQSRCGLHCQSKFTLEQRQDLSRASARARDGRALRWLLGSRGLKQVRASTAEMISGALFALEGPALERWRQEVLTALTTTPSVRNELPADFDGRGYADTVDCLRSALDPQEWSPNAWPQRLLLAEQWLRARRAADLMGTRSIGLSDTNRVRVARAKGMLWSGASKDEVARQLGVSRDYLRLLFWRELQARG